MKPTLRGTMIDIALNIIVPYIIYTIAHDNLHLSEVTALTLSSLYPLVDLIREFAKDKTLNFIAGIVLLGTATSIIGALIGGDPRIILIRESIFTFLLAIACFISLAFHRPLMFYFGREFAAGKDPEKRREFSKLLEKKGAYDTFSMITIVWGIVYALEFALKVVIVYTFSIKQSLIIAPVSTYCIVFATIAWTIWYGKRKRAEGQKRRS